MNYIHTAIDTFPTNSSVYISNLLVISHDYLESEIWIAMAPTEKKIEYEERRIEKRHEIIMNTMTFIVVGKSLVIPVHLEYIVNAFFTCYSFSSHSNKHNIFWLDEWMILKYIHIHMLHKSDVCALNFAHLCVIKKKIWMEAF